MDREKRAERLITALERAERLKPLLDDPIVAGWFSDHVAALMQVVIDTDDPAVRERAVLEVRVTRGLLNHLRQTVIRGEQADKELRNT